MKKVKKAIAFLLVFPGVLVMSIFADPPDPVNPPAPGGSPVNNGEPVGAPIDGGIGFLLLLCAGYGVKKIYTFNKLTLK